MRPVLFALTALAFATPAALAQSPGVEMDGDRYLMVETEDAVLRIERQSGEVSECRQSGNGWICRLAADDRLAYEAEINRLDAEVERLEEELAAAEEALEAEQDSLSLAPDSGMDGDESDDPSMRERLDLPSEEELDAVMETAEEVMRRFFGMVERLREDIEAERAQ